MCWVIAVNQAGRRCRRRPVRGYHTQVASDSLTVKNDLAQRLAAARRELEANVLQLDLARTRLQATRQQISAGRAERQVLHDSAVARLAARLDSQPVIEQAKGILIAQVGCTPDEAFDMLRAASQRTNVRVRDLARDIVDRVASNGGTAGRPGLAIGDQPRRIHGPG
jgi:ANTAR domain-containing protein